VHRVRHHRHVPDPQPPDVTGARVIEGSPDAGGGRFTSVEVKHVDGDIFNNYYRRHQV
jgi:hypothetical protein